ncbi:hypothetical protein GCM10025760_35060 [Microbacterium yannicii]|uniref:Uncharacterized protein n=1 Tax=Microbacterium yannicii TaxID=671622 RepID=A0ABP9MN03_9MICO|nr:hypothetical protein [Microbacterium yannicii]MCO5951969.1 hypothetical protein [Microbacterium yannicii]
MTGPRATETTSPPPVSFGHRAQRLARMALRAEIGIWKSLYRWLFRRPRVPVGATGFAYHSPVLTILVIFIVLSAIEIPIIDLIVHDWPAVRIPLLVAGIWGVTWMIGLLLGFLTRPHAVGPEGIRARSGAEVDIDLPWESVASVEKSRDVLEKAPKIRDEPHGRTLALRMQDETNVLVILERPVAVRLGDTADEVGAVRLWADDLDGFMTAVRTHIP